MDRQPEFMNFPGDGLTLAGARWAGGGRAVICIHGMAGSCLHWNLVARNLPPAFTAHAADLRGRGKSDKPAEGYGIHHHRRDILAMMDGLGLKTAVVMGHSLGAAIALALAAENPERVERLILVDGGGKLSPEQTQKVLAGIKPTLDRLGRVFASFADYLALMKAAPMLSPWSDDMEEMFRYDVEQARGGVRSRVAPYAVEQEIKNLPLADPLALQKKVSCPTLILRALRGMVADDDLLLPQDAADTMMANIRGARLVNLPESNHYTIVLRANPQRDRAIAEFLGQ